MNLIAFWQQKFSQVGSILKRRKNENIFLKNTKSEEIMETTCPVIPVIKAILVSVSTDVSLMIVKRDRCDFEQVK